MEESLVDFAPLGYDRNSWINSRLPGSTYQRRSSGLVKDYGTKK